MKYGLGLTTQQQPRRPLTVRTSKYRVHHVALAATLPLLVLAAALFPAGDASAASIDGVWVWPQTASANSCRWIRIQVGVSTSEEVYSVSLSGVSAADSYAPNSGMPIGTVLQGGFGGLFGRTNTDTTVLYAPSRTVRYFTIGPFVGSLNAFGQRPADWPYVIGYLSSPGANTTQPVNAATHTVGFTVLTYSTSDNSISTTVLNTTTGYRTVHDNDDYLDWNRPDGSGGNIDPLRVGPVEVLPDSGSGSSSFSFRVRYTSGLYSGISMEPLWRTSETFPDSGSAGFWDRSRGFPQQRSGPDSVNQFNWLYGRTTDPWLDQVGYARAEFDQRGAVEPRVMLVIDGKHWAPHYMIPEEPGDTNYTDGALYTYTIRPTDFMNFIDNIFLFPFDLPGQDLWDNWATRVSGTPVSNNYVSMTAGPHTYEFWATDDFAPVRNRAWVQVGWPGNDAHVEYMERTAPEPRRVDGLRSALRRGRISVYNEQQGGAAYTFDELRRFNDVSVDQPDPYGYTLKSHNASTNADLPTDLEALGSANVATSLRKFPNVNPVLTAHPFFGITHREGGITTALPAATTAWGTPDFSSVGQNNPSVSGGYIDNAIPNNAFIPDGNIGALPNPFEAETDAGPAPPNGPWKYTNDDTILPNFANIWNELAPTPFRGGKWTRGTNYTLRVNYWHSENVAPRFMRVYIRRNTPDPANPGAAPGQWFAYTMENADNDGRYDNGAVFQYQATPDQLPTNSSRSGGGVGEYNYYFEANDGTRTAIFPNRPDAYQGIDDPGDIGVPSGPEGRDYYWFRVNQRPILTENSVTPTVGNAGDPFTFKVKYTDPDGEAGNPDARGDRPFIAHLYVDLYGDQHGQHSVAAAPANEFTLEYENTDGYLFATNELAGLYVVMEDGTAVRQIYRIAGNNGNTITLVSNASDPDHPGSLQTDGVQDGDLFYIAQRTAMDRDTSSANAADYDGDYTNGEVYVFNTGTNMILGPGNHRYFFRFADDWGEWVYPGQTDVHVEGEYVRFPNAREFSGPQVIENRAPELVDFRFLPQDVGAAPDGSTSTPFIFYVSYVDRDNDPPAFIRLELDGGTTLNMFPEDASDKVYTDGAVYRTAAIQLTEGQHFMRAQASDAELRFPPATAYPPGDPLPFMGPVATVAGAVSSATVLPYTVGGKTFADGRYNGGGITIRMLSGAAAGKTYTIASNAGSNLTLTAGADLIADGVADGDQFIFGAAPGPKVAANTAPQLIFPADDANYNPDPNALELPGLEPDSGVPEDLGTVPPTPATTFTYRVIYIDNDQFAGVRGNPPAYVQVYIDSVAYDMTPVDPTDTDYTTNGRGAEYTLTVPDTGASPPIPPLNEGTPHTYFFVASDGLDTARLPALGTVTDDRYDGPIVDGRPDPPQQLFVTDTPNDNGDSMQWQFNASLDDGGGADDVVEYHLYRNTTGAPFADPPILVIPADNSPSYAGQDPPSPAVDTGLQKGVAYFYTVRAYDGPSIDQNRDGLPDQLPDDGSGVPQYVPIDPLDQSFDSNIEGPVTPEDNIPPGAPTFFAAVNPGLGGTIELSWGPSPDDGSGGQDVVEYRIYRATSQAGLQTGPPLVVIPAGETEYVDLTAIDGTDYWYGITAWDGANESVLVPADPSPIASSDAAPPEIINLVPANGDIDVPVDTNIQFDLRDTGAGIDISSLKMTVTVGGVATDLTQNDLTTTNLNGLTRVVYDPPVNFSYLVSVGVHIEVSDLAGDPTANPVEPPNSATLDYRFTIIGPPVYAIEGTIIDPDGLGNTIPDVLKDITVRAYPIGGGMFLQTKTDENGNYRIDGLAAGDYYVKPFKRGLSFTPDQSVPLTVPPSPQRADFTARTGYDIGGMITDKDGNPLADVRVSNGVTEVSTDADGSWVIQDAGADTYTVIPLKDGYNFTPVSRDVTVPSAEMDQIDFVGDVERYFVSGNIKSSAGARLGGILVEVYDDNDQKVILRDANNNLIEHRTSASGDYFIDGLAAGFYSIRPTDVDWVFDPVSRDINVSSDRNDVDFIGLPLYRFTLAPGLDMVALPITPRDLNPANNIPAGVDIARWDPTMPDSVLDKYIKGNPGAPVPAQYQMVPGRSFWMRNNNAAAVVLAIPDEPVDTSIDFSLGIERGWNMAGNMFDTDLPWSKLSITPGEPVRDYGFLYNKATNNYDLITDIPGLGTQTVIPKNAGFWIKSDQKRTVTVKAVGTTDAGAESVALELGDSDFLVPIVARADRCADTMSVAGVLTSSSDDIRIENPPAVSPYVDVYFVRQSGERLACDVRSAAAETQSWDFVVATDLPGAKVELTLPDLSSVPADKTVWLLDQASGKRLYARTLSGYGYTADGKGLRKFTLEVAPKSAAGLVISAGTASQSGDRASVSYTLSAPATTSVSILNIAGRAVRVLQTGAVAPAGVNTVAWDLRGDSGTRVPAGRYLVRIEAVAENGQAASTVVTMQVNR